MPLADIRNFCIIAHIDHGKSTLADRLLEVTGTLTSREMSEQVLDSMDLEREKGITIKAQAVRMSYRAPDGHEYELNLIDTPGHVDFAYEVSRSLAACEGAVLVVDASQGIEAQTLANASLARRQGLTLIPVVNKIDLPSAQPERVALEIESVFGLPLESVVFVSAKLGQGIDELLRAIVERIPPPRGRLDAPARGLIFDSHYDVYKGVVAYVRMFDGRIAYNSRALLMATGRTTDVLEVGMFKPRLTLTPELTAGEVGYVATGLKNVKDCQVGDTITTAQSPAREPLPGYQPAKPMVFAGLYPVDNNEYHLLRDALDKLKLNDASLFYQPETSVALGFGYRCGFLGSLHMEIVQERIEREYNLDILATAPSVEYHVLTRRGDLLEVDNPADFPSVGEIEQVEEPWVSLTIVVPTQYLGAMMDLVQSRRGEFSSTDYLDESRVLMHCNLPLAEMVVGFYDQLKSRSQGYASLDYTFLGYRTSDLAKVDILVNNQPVDALSLIVHRSAAHQQGRAIIERLRKLIPRQLFDVPLQAAIGAKIIARETIPAMRKNVLAKCYGGDVTRKRKLLEKQREGKLRLKRLGSVEIPQEAFMSLLEGR